MIGKYYANIFHFIERCWSGEGIYFHVGICAIIHYDNWTDLIKCSHTLNIIALVVASIHTYDLLNCNEYLCISSQCVSWLWMESSRIHAALNRFLWYGEWKIFVQGAAQKVVGLDKWGKWIQKYIQTLERVSCFGLKNTDFSHDNPQANSAEIR